MVSFCGLNYRSSLIIQMDYWANSVYHVTFSTQASSERKIHNAHWHSFYSCIGIREYRNHMFCDERQWLYVCMYLILAGMKYNIQGITSWIATWGHQALTLLNTLRPRKWPPFSRRHFKMDFLEWKCTNFDYYFAEVRGPINNIPKLVQLMAWRRPGDKALSEPMMARLPTHIRVTRPQWVNLLIWIPVIYSNGHTVFQAK